MKSKFLGEPQEEWRDIKGYEGIYQVSSLGNVRSLDIIQKRSNGKVECLFKIRGKILKPYQTGKTAKNNDGYLTVNLSKKQHKVHRLVAEAFLENPHKLEQINHIDGDKTNNRVDNLEWCSPQKNVHHAYEIGLSRTGEEIWCTKLKEEDVAEIRKTYIKGDKERGAKPLSRKYGVSNTTIRRIVNKKKWRYCNES